MVSDVGSRRDGDDAERKGQRYHVSLLYRK